MEALLFGFDHFVARDFGVIRTITKRSKFVRLATFTVVTMIAATALYVGAGTTNHIVSTLVSRGEGTLAVEAAFLPGVEEERRAGQRLCAISLPSEVLRSFVARGSSTLVFHPHMLSQSLLRACFVITLVTFWRLHSSCTISSWDLS